MREPTQIPAGEGAATCAQCSFPLDAQPFDVSSVARAPEPGRSLVLARFELPPQYCGVLEYFSQFTDAFGLSPRDIETPGLRWTLRVNQRPLYPYADLGHIINPWGFGCYPVRLRLDDGATLELVVRGLKSDERPAVARVGGRVVGRFWYNPVFVHAPAGCR